MNKRQRKKHDTKLRDRPSYLMTCIGLPPKSQGEKKKMKIIDKAIRKRNKDKKMRCLPFTILSINQKDENFYSYESAKKAMQDILKLSSTFRNSGVKCPERHWFNIESTDSRVCWILHETVAKALGWENRDDVIVAKKIPTENGINFSDLITDETSNIDFDKRILGKDWERICE